MPVGHPNLLAHFDINLSPDIIHYKRSIYSTLDFLGDLGGLYDALWFLCRFFIGIYSLIVGSELDNFLLKTLFKRKLHVKQASNIPKSPLSDIKQTHKFTKESRVFIYCRNRREKLV